LQLLYYNNNKYTWQDTKTYNLSVFLQTFLHT